MILIQEARYIKEFPLSKDIYKKPTVYIIFHSETLNAFPLRLRNKNACIHCYHCSVKSSSQWSEAKKKIKDIQVEKEYFLCMQVTLLHM